MIRLQKVIFSKPGICYENEMFFRLISTPQLKQSPCRFFSDAQKLEIDKNGIVSFDTYFNGLSIGKFKKYTSVQRVCLKLKLCGTFRIQLLHSKVINGTVLKKCLDEIQICAIAPKWFTFEFPECDPCGAVSFSIFSLQDGGTLLEGEYLAVITNEALNHVELALNICNYRKEHYVYRNMDIIRRHILDSENSILRDHIHIFIADNSSSIDSERIPACAKVFPQGDFGGAGGFTRGLIEILQRQNSLGLTHVVMMDDDVLIEPDSLERLYALLCTLKQEYLTAFIGGALLRLDHQHIQTIHGGGWDWKNYYLMHKTNANLLDPMDVLLNEIEDGAKINGWWFHCIPLTEISLSNLPYPFFFHMDDVEYDLRNCKKIININGICVWHEPFENKPGSHIYYYNTRNVLITYAIYADKLTVKDVIQYLNREFFRHLLIYRYKEAELVLRGIKDALRGPDWLVSQNPEQLLEDILKQGYKKQELVDLNLRFDYGVYLHNCTLPSESRRQKMLRKLSLNGYLLKAKRNSTIVPMFVPQSRTVYRSKFVLNYDPISEKGFITCKSYLELFRCIFHYLKVRLLIRKNLNKLKTLYKQSFKKMTNHVFWKQYLDPETYNQDA